MKPNFELGPRVLYNAPTPVHKFHHRIQSGIHCETIEETQLLAETAKRTQHIAGSTVTRNTIESFLLTHLLTDLFR